MPFKSEAQRRYLWANEPDVAKRWAHGRYSKLAQVWREYKKERAEHPTLPKEAIEQIAIDHTAKMTGVASVPTGQKTYRQGIDRAKLGKTWMEAKRRGALVCYMKGKPFRGAVARFQIGMNNWAEVEVAFLREGFFHINGVRYFHPWEVIEQAAKTYEGQPFYIDHIERSGVEMGLIDKVYVKVIDGIKWLCAKVKVPETAFTQNFLERIQTGLIKDVSSTHFFYTDPADKTKTIKHIVGQGISTVKDGEVDGAKILDIERNQKGNNYNPRLREAVIKSGWKAK